jgi:cytochrome c oxidase subunit I
MDLSVGAVHILGISSILNSINLIITVGLGRGAGDSFSRVSLILFAGLVTSLLLLLVVPVLAVGVFGGMFYPGF